MLCSRLFGKSSNTIHNILINAAIQMGSKEAYLSITGIVFVFPLHIHLLHSPAWLLEPSGPQCLLRMHEHLSMAMKVWQ